MAIVLKYGSPGSILQAQFAAGIGHRNELQTDDLLKVWQQNQVQNFQGQQSALHRQQQAALQQQNQNFQADQAVAVRGAQAQARAQQVQQADLTRQQQQKHYDDLQHQTTLQGLASGKLELPQSAQKELQKLDEGRVLIQGPGWTDQDRAQFDADYEKRKKALYATAVPKTHTPATDFNAGTVHVDESGKGYDQPGEGRTPYNTRTGKPVFDHTAEVAAQQKAQAAAQKQQEKMQADMAKQQEKLQASTVEYGKQVLAAAQHLQKAATPTDGTSVPPLDGFIEEAKKHLSAVGITAPQQAPAAAQPVQGQAQTGKWGDGQHGEPITQAPAAAASTASTADQDEQFNAQWATLQPGQSLRGPDGTIYIKKKAQ